MSVEQGVLLTEEIAYKPSGEIPVESVRNKVGDNTHNSSVVEVKDYSEYLIVQLYPDLFYPGVSQEVDSVAEEQMLQLSYPVIVFADKKENKGGEEGRIRDHKINKYRRIHHQKKEPSASELGLPRRGSKEWKRNQNKFTQE